MLFNSLAFALFLPVVFSLYWLLGRNLRLQNLVLLAASYFFYGFWDWRFLSLLAFSTILDFFIGLKIASAEQKTRRRWLILSVLINLGILGIFKYYNFFASQLADGLAAVGLTINPWTLKIILPLGISFYTFHGLSYVFDIYRRKITPTHNLVNYAVFVSFFPLLVAGPIERAQHLLPQIERPRRFDYTRAVDGLRQMLWGFFKKIAIADVCARYVDLIFGAQGEYSGGTLLIGAVLFAIQIYCDFSGYSDIAIGVAKLFNIELLRNFSYPYFARDIAEFWRRWHISLTSWFRDYLYIPLGGSRQGKGRTVLNTFIIFLVCGFWHGANWTFIVWGFINAIYFLPLLLLNRNRRHLDITASGRFWPSYREIAGMATTFLLSVFAWIFFRSPDLPNAFQYLVGLVDFSDWGVIGVEANWRLASVIIFFFLWEWVNRQQPHALAGLSCGWPRFQRWAFYLLLTAMILVNFGGSKFFVYFQF